MDERKRQDTARPAILHLDVLAVLLFHHHIRIDFAHRPFALGLNNLEVAGDARPRIVESLVGIVPVDERDTGEGVAEPLCDMFFFS